MKSKRDLEKEANRILYGTSYDPVERESRAVFGGHFYTPIKVNVKYDAPKQSASWAVCSTCNRPRSASSGSQCRECYYGNVQAKYREKLGFLEYWETQKDTAA